METEVWVIVMRRHDGTPGKAEKVSNGRFYMIRTDADKALLAMDNLVVRGAFTVARALITIAEEQT